MMMQRAAKMVTDNVMRIFVNKFTHILNLHVFIHHYSFTIICIFLFLNINKLSGTYLQMWA